MNFQEAVDAYRNLRNQLGAHQITPQEFREKVATLRVQDSNGRWWQIRGADGVWLRWNGTTWVEASPPHHARPAVVPRHPAARRAAAPGKPQPPAPPQTMAQLLGLVLRSMLKGLLWKIPLAIGVAFLTWIVHTFLLVGPNGGFASGTNPILDSVLALRGKMISGTLFWALLVGLASVIFARLRQVGPAKTLRSILGTPAWIQDSLRRSRTLALPILVGGSALALLTGTLLGNRLVSLQLVAAAVGALIAQHESFLFLVMRLAWSDAQRLFKRPPKEFNLAWAGMGTVGATFGFFGASILPSAPYCGCAGVLLLAGVMVALILSRRGKPAAGTLLLLLAVAGALALATTPAYADDGGWAEAGGNFSDWIRSEGGTIAIMMGLPPALAAAIGAVLGGVIAGIGSTAPSVLSIKELENSLNDIAKDLKDKGYYVKNPLMDKDPTMIVDGWYKAIITEGMDAVTGWKSSTCEDYVNISEGRVKKAVEEAFGKNAKVERIVFEEKSSYPEKGERWYHIPTKLDRLNEMNHILFRVTLPDGTQKSVDLWDNARGEGPVIRDWKDTVDKWRKAIGEGEFKISE